MRNNPLIGQQSTIETLPSRFDTIFLVPEEQDDGTLKGSSTRKNTLRQHSTCKDLQQ